MNPNIHEDCRPLHEFYPDPTLRHRVHYMFAHQFLPSYILHRPIAFFGPLYQDHMPGMPFDPTRYLHSRWTVFEELARLIPLEDDPLEDGIVVRRVTDLTATREAVGGHPAVLITMPKPEEGVEAFFLAAILLASLEDPGAWPKHLQARVFTLEALCDDHSEFTLGVVCEWQGEAHLNHRRIARAEPAEFLREVARILEAQGDAARSSGPG